MLKEPKAAWFVVTTSFEFICGPSLRSLLGYPEAAQTYLDATGDIDGVENINGVPLGWQRKLQALEVLQN